MLAARADLTLDGPSVAVRVHGDGPVLIADVRPNLRGAARALFAVADAVRGARTISRALRATGLRVDVRIAGRTVARLG